MTRRTDPPAPSPFEHPRLRQAGKFFLDTFLAALAWDVAANNLGRGWRQSLPYFAAWLPLAMATNLSLRLTRQHYRAFGFRDAMRLFVALLLFTAIGAALDLYDRGDQMHRGQLLAAGLLAVFLWLLLRGAVRALGERAARAGLPGPSGSDPGWSRTLIVGAGRAGLLVGQELRRHPELGCHVVGFADDALDKQGIFIQGIPVLGTSEVLAAVIRQHGINQVVLAIPSAPGSVLRALSEVVRHEGIQVKTVPGLFNLLGTQTWKPELRDISIEDLLRREPVKLDQSALAQILEDSVVLITGAGGSIGSELARQCAAFRPSRIVLLGRGENSLWETERSLRAAFPNQALALELCDIRNPNRLDQAFGRWKPKVVLHAAAHKHVPYLEVHPAEGVENNIFGTLQVIEAALRHEVHTFVNISTDKAVNPTNVLGATKRIAECLVLRAADRAPGGVHFASVRFGNVLGSRGSVIPVFRDQIKRGGPITVTHPDMTRYFMTIPEASQLVLQAGILGDTGKVYVLDMGQPVRIVDLATDMARLSGLVPDQDIEIQFSGIRPGEKLFEELFGANEQMQSQVHPKVFEAVPEHLDFDLLEQGLKALWMALALPEGDRQREILHWLKRLVPTYKPSALGLGRFESGGDARVSGPAAAPILPLHPESKQA